jgi:RNA 3'-terminal phosphate cyclase (ATP)
VNILLGDEWGMAMIEIDGSRGEGGGQVLRSALALSLVTGKPFRMVNIRAGRQRPGLMRQHLTAVLAASEVGKAQVTGAEVGSCALTFQPGAVRPGDYHFSVGTAGSTTLVFQTVFPALALAAGRSTMVLDGGTHNPFAPTFEFLERVYLPLVARMGPQCTATLERPGFYPAGGGRFRVEITPAPSFGRLELLERGEVRKRRAVALVALLPRTIGQREVETLQALLGWESSCCQVESVRDAVGPGNVVWAEVESEHVTELFTGFGEKRVPAERVAAALADEVAQYLAAGVPVGRHLADQLVLPMALGAGGAFRTFEPSGHTRTHIDLLQAFLGTLVEARHVESGAWRIDVAAR